MSENTRDYLVRINWDLSDEEIDSIGLPLVVRVPKSVQNIKEYLENTYGYGDDYTIL